MSSVKVTVIDMKTFKMERPYKGPFYMVGLNGLGLVNRGRTELLDTGREMFDMIEIRSGEEVSYIAMSEKNKSIIDSLLLWDAERRFKACYRAEKEGRVTGMLIQRLEIKALPFWRRLFNLF